MQENIRLHRPYEQAATLPLSYDEMARLQRVAAQAGVSADPARQGHDLMRAA